MNNIQFKEKNKVIKMNDEKEKLKEEIRTLIKKLNEEFPNKWSKYSLCCYPKSW
jgi:hypothetical protein